MAIKKAEKTLEVISGKKIILGSDFIEIEHFVSNDIKKGTWYKIILNKNDIFAVYTKDNDETCLLIDCPKYSRSFVVKKSMYTFLIGE